MSEDGALIFTIAIFAVAAVMLMARGGWAFFQGTIFIAIMGSNIQWQWTPNGYLASLIGIGVAYFATVVLSWIIDLSRRRQGLRLRSHKH